MQRLKNMFNSLDAVTKAAHILQYLFLVQKQGESGADFVDKEQREFLTLHEVGIDMNDSRRFTKYI